MERTDDAGRWTSENGAAWTLVDPTPAWLAAQEAAQAQADQPRPLSPTGALATLLAVTEVLELTDAANSVRLTEQALVDEALAWAAAAG